jgi:uncharacterized membrane protein YfcA
VETIDILILLGAGLLAGAVNALAGGGTLVTFPVLMGLGLAAKLANATSQVALWPGRLTSLVPQLRSLRALGPSAWLSFVIALLGGISGALLLIALPEGLFRTMVPWLLLLATLLFASARSLQTVIGLRRRQGKTPLPLQIFGRMCEYIVCVYGGFFGAGLGVILMAGYALAGMQDLRQTNALKNLMTLLITSVSALTFIVRGEVAWRPCAVMLVGALIGGYAGGVFARWCPDRPMRIGIIGFGFLLTGYYFAKVYG